MKDVICLILGGGQGTRLYPLTKDRSKPAVPIGGKFRLIDIPISNSLNSDINKILILTQFNSASLNKHVNQTFRFDYFHSGFVDILAAEQTNTSTGWYQGTADAVRQTIKHFMSFPHVKYVLILSGDQIYKMDFRELLSVHKENGNDLTISVLPVTKKEAGEFGIMNLEGNRVTEFFEKPKDEALLSRLRSPQMIAARFPGIDPSREYLASMGIYLFNVETLLQLLDNDHKDFGKEVIPAALGQVQVGGHLFNGYWEDVGNIGSFHRANMDFVGEHPKFDFYDNKIYTHARYLPPTKMIDAEVKASMVCEGSIIQKSWIKSSVIGIRSIIGEGCRLERCVIMGADYYQREEAKEEDRKKGLPPVGIGRNCVIKNAIIDKNARIGEGCRILNEKKIQHHDDQHYAIRDGIVVVPKNSFLPPGTVI